jgi:hypothetical protein
VILVCGDIIFECSEERAEAILKVQRQMRVNDWQLKEENADTRTDTGLNKDKAAQARTRPGKGSSK